MKCTKINCPMQAGIISDDCNRPDCPWRTEPGITDKVFRNMLERNGYDPDIPGEPFRFLADMLLNNNMDEMMTKEEQEYIEKQGDNYIKEVQNVQAYK